MIGFATWVIGTNTKKGVSMRQDTAKIHEIISKAVITKKANPTLVQSILSWCKDTVTTIIYKEKF
tara:strand:+ start:739 stop:933 length:195 start_codon:yes stop_codon:yes gene_type:complete